MTVGQEPSMDLPSAFSSPMEGPCDLAHAILLVREKSGGAMRFVQAGAGEQRCAGRLRQGARHDPQRAAAPPAPGQRPRADASPLDPRSSPDRCRRLSSASKFPFIPGSLQLRLSAQGHTLALLCLSSGPSLSGRPRDYSREAGECHHCSRRWEAAHDGYEHYQSSSKRRGSMVLNGRCECHCRRDAIESTQIDLIMHCAACKGALYKYHKVDLSAATCRTE
jgi:hypothetical protein